MNSPRLLLLLLVLLPLFYIEGSRCYCSSGVPAAVALPSRIGRRVLLPPPLPLPLPSPRRGALGRGVGGELRLPRRPRGGALGGHLRVELGAEGLRCEGLGGEGGRGRGRSGRREERREEGV